MKTIDTQQLTQRIDAEQIPVIDVLAGDQFQQGHLPGAVNVPLDDQFDSKIQAAVPDKSQEVIVYCASPQCSASPKAAQRMEALGYQNVIDYEGGKQAWQDNGLSLETSA